MAWEQELFLVQSTESSGYSCYDLEENVKWMWWCLKMTDEGSQ